MSAKRKLARTPHWAGVAMALAYTTLFTLLSGCDNGGLLVVDHKPPTTVQGPSVNDMVSGGNLAQNGKYRLFYTNGQPSPHQGVSANSANRHNGGLVGAAHGD
ncbi:MAG: hypothetical protein IPK82_27160 [Polyangiaceae bacterium]|nr:hypothetical protein [Polyangiaceae bacterium]